MWTTLWKAVDRSVETCGISPLGCALSRRITLDTAPECTAIAQFINSPEDRFERLFSGLDEVIHSFHNG